MHAQPTLLARPIEQFRPAQPSLRLEYDASLTAIAVGVSDCSTAPARLLGFTVVTLPFPATTDSSFQNTYEYMAVLAGLLLAQHLGYTSFAYSLHGDSVSSLQWSTRGRAASSRARRTNVAIALLSVHLRATLVDTVHVPGVDNIVYDGLSRGKTASEVGLEPTLQIFWPTLGPTMSVLRSCDPTTPLSSLTEYGALFATCLSAFRAVSHPPTLH
jgi:hypothetical protein